MSLRGRRQRGGAFSVRLPGCHREGESLSASPPPKLEFDPGLKGAGPLLRCFGINKDSSCTKKTDVR